ncbi:MAG: o-succinylbenzoate synthase [Actinomycetaceae bacterium]|nr:o-succinylbenzoate synthase [Actinomycetaceae bacterium]
MARWYSRRVRIVDASVRRVALPLRKPIRTARTTLTEREVLIVQLVADDGTCGYGEVSSFTTDWYLPETLGDDEVLMPALLDAVRGCEFASPREVDAVLRAVEGAQALPVARAGVECAAWDIFARLSGMPLARYLGFTGDKAAGGVVIPLADTETTVCEVRAAASAGYQRVKVKIAGARDIDTLEAIRQSFPDICLLADANGAFSEQEFGSIAHRIDALDCACIEEPILRHPGEVLEDFYLRLKNIQERVNTPLCLDESWVNEEELRVALEIGAAGCYALKICKLGGIGATLEILDEAHRRGIAMWMGGMFDTGISKAAHAALSLHPANAFAGDISDTSRYFIRDICKPAFTLRDGYLDLTHPGLGFATTSLNE